MPLFLLQNLSKLKEMHQILMETKSQLERLKGVHDEFIKTLPFCITLNDDESAKRLNEIGLHIKQIEQRILKSLADKSDDPVRF
jgi:hypothetical protein